MNFLYDNEVFKQKWLTGQNKLYIFLFNIVSFSSAPVIIWLDHSLVIAEDEENCTSIFALYSNFSFILFQYANHLCLIAYVYERIKCENFKNLWFSSLLYLSVDLLFFFIKNKDRRLGQSYFATREVVIEACIF